MGGGELISASQLKSSPQQHGNVSLIAVHHPNISTMLVIHIINFAFIIKREEILHRSPSASKSDQSRF